MIFGKKKAKEKDVYKNFIKKGQLAFLNMLKSTAQETEQGAGPLSTLYLLFAFENEVFSRSKKDDICNDNTMYFLFEGFSLLNFLYHDYYSLVTQYTFYKERDGFKDLTDKEFNGIKFFSKYENIISEHIDGINRIMVKYDEVFKQFDEEINRLEESETIDDSRFVLKPKQLVEQIDKAVYYINTKGPISLIAYEKNK